MCWSQYWVCPYLAYLPCLAGCVSVPNMLGWVRTWIEICPDIPRWGLTGKTTSRPSYLFSWLLYLLVSTRQPQCPQITTFIPPWAPGNHTRQSPLMLTNGLKLEPDIFLDLELDLVLDLVFSPSNYPGCYSWLTDKLKSWFPALLKTSLC